MAKCMTACKIAVLLAFANLSWGAQERNDDGGNSGGHRLAGHDHSWLSASGHRVALNIDPAWITREG